MQLDLQSVQQVPFSTFARAFTPKMLEIGIPRLRMSRSFLQDLSRAVSCFSSGPVAGNHRQHFFDPTESNTITFPDRIEKIGFFVIHLDCLSVLIFFLHFFLSKSFFFRGEIYCCCSTGAALVLASREEGTLTKNIAAAGPAFNLTHFYCNVEKPAIRWRDVGVCAHDSTRVDGRRKC